MKENNRGGLDFIHWKIVTEIRAKKTCLRLLSFQSSEVKLFLCWHRWMSRLFPRLKWFHLCSAGSSHALLSGYVTHAQLAGGEKLAGISSKLTWSCPEGTSKPRSRLVLWLLQDFELLRSHRHVLRTEHCPARLHRRNLWCDETDKMDCFSWIRNDSEPLRFSENLKTPMEIHWKDWCWSWNANTLATWCKELTHLKRPWCWERLKVGGEGDDRGWDGWMPSLTQWTWVWVSSGSWWWTGKPGVL